MIGRNFPARPAIEILYRSFQTSWKTRVTRCDNIDLKNGGDDIRQDHGGITHGQEKTTEAPGIVYHADNAETAKKLVLRKAGICFPPGLSVRQEVAEGSLVPIEIEETAGIALRTNLVALSGEHEEIIRLLRSLDVRDAGSPKIFAIHK